MATGDNVLTAISVARNCKILSENEDVILGDFDPSTNKLSWNIFDSSV
jgi:magnesium-transporting ATPase (P-type)